jgi:hypothetical protein
MVEEKLVGDIYHLLPAIAQAIGPVLKDRSNQSQGYKFRGIDDFYSAISDPLSKHGVTVVPTMCEIHREEHQTKSGGTLHYSLVNVGYRFQAADGSFIDAMVAGEGMDSGDKSLTKAFTAAYKTLMTQTFCIRTDEDKDSEIDSPESKGKVSKPAALGFDEVSGLAGSIVEAFGDKLDQGLAILLREAGIVGVDYIGKDSREKLVMMALFKKFQVAVTKTAVTGLTDQKLKALHDLVYSAALELKKAE